MRTPRRSAGRPNKLAADQISAKIPQVAGDLFIERGYGGTSVDDVAARAGVAKHTIYRRFTSKEELFVFSVLSIFRNYRDTFGPRVLNANEAPELTLKTICRADLDTVLDSKVLGLYRVAHAEAHRFPEMVATLRDDILEDTVDLIAPLIKAAQLADRCMPGEPRFLAKFLLLSVTGLPFTRALLGATDLSTGHARDAYFDKAWEIARRMFSTCQSDNTRPRRAIKSIERQRTP